MGNLTNNGNTKSQKVNHPKFKQLVSVKIKGQTDEDLMTLQVPIQDYKCFNQWQLNLNKMSNLKDQNFLLPKSYQFIKNTLCGDSGVLYINYDQYPHLLSDEVQSRMEINKRFQEKQLWYLIYVLIESASEFYQLYRKIGDIRPQNVFINKNGQIKVACINSWPSELSNYDKTLLYSQTTYLSPEELLQCKLTRIQSNSNPQKGESFSIGLTILQALTLRKMDCLYDRQSRVFQINLLKLIIQEIQDFCYFCQDQHQNVKYSNSLLYAISKFCEIDPKDRLTVTECYKWLSPYSNDILNLVKIDIPMPNPFQTKYLNKNSQKNRTRPVSQNKYLLSSGRSINLNNIKCNSIKKNGSTATQNYMNSNNSNKTKEKLFSSQQNHLQHHFPHRVFSSVEGRHLVNHSPLKPRPPFVQSFNFSPANSFIKFQQINSPSANIFIPYSHNNSKLHHSIKQDSKKYTDNSNISFLPFNSIQIPTRFGRVQPALQNRNQRFKVNNVKKQENLAEYMEQTKVSKKQKYPLSYFSIKNELPDLQSYQSDQIRSPFTISKDQILRKVNEQVQKSRKMFPS